MYAIKFMRKSTQIYFDVLFIIIIIIGAACTTGREVRLPMRKPTAHYDLGDGDTPDLKHKGERTTGQQLILMYSIFLVIKVSFCCNQVLELEYCLSSHLDGWRLVLHGFC